MSKTEIIKRPIEQAGSDIKKSAWSAVLESMVLLVLGFLCAIWPDTIVQVIALIIGCFFIVRGGVIIINYFLEENQKDYFNNRLLSGVICTLIGIAILVAGQSIAHIFSVIIGILIIYESLVRLNAALKLRAAKVVSWKQMIVISLIMLVIGIIVTFSTGGAIALAGWLMVVTGVIGIIGDVIFIQHVNMIIDKLAGKK
ncbi:DUF308 domain-containing protein [Candidatus Saccharibacteria bacterium]|nr:DUF308 domain-containing protein [Candidatus Saccharibacteria bacterium]